MYSLFDDPVPTYDLDVAAGLIVPVADLVPGDMAREAGWMMPVVLTTSVAELVRLTAAEEAAGQTLEGRLREVLRVGAEGMHRATGSVARFSVSFALADRPSHLGREPRSIRSIQLKAEVGPGDGGRPMVTIALGR